MKTNTPAAGAVHTGTAIPPHISQSRWRETAAIMGSFAALTAAGVWFATRPEQLTQDQAKAKAAAADHPPELIAESARSALAAAVTATVPVKVKVEANGEVSESKVETPTPALAALEARAVAAARSYKFKPAQKAGASIEGFVTVPVRFEPMPNARRLSIRGSDTIGSALGPAWAGALEAKHPEVQVEIESLGSSTGFAGLFDGSAELAASSRPIKPEEQEQAKRLGFELKAAITGHDGIAVIVNPANPLKQLDLLTLAKVFSGKVGRWNEIGASDAPIRALGRPTYSGTNAFFRERVLGKAAFGAEVEPVESSQALTGRVVSDPNAIAYVSYSHVIPSVHSLGLSAQPGSAAITPSPESLRDGSYPIARPLMLYWRADASRDALSYVELALSPVGQALVKQAGFVPLNADEKNPDAAEAIAKLKDTQDAPAGAEGAVHKAHNSRVYFEVASASLNEQGKDDLQKVAELLKQGKRAIIVGNADASGKQTGNSQFAKRRADAVAAQLKKLGVDPSNVTVQVANSDVPLATNETEEGRRENRRVDVLVIEK